MEDFQKKALDECMNDMKEELEPAEFFTDFVEKGILSSDETRNIQQGQDAKEQVSQLISILQTKSGNSFRHFVKFLESKEEYLSIAKDLSSKEITFKQNLEELALEMAKYPDIAADFQLQEVLLTVSGEINKRSAKRLHKKFGIPATGTKGMTNIGNAVITSLLEKNIISVENLTTFMETCETLELKNIKRHLEGYKENNKNPEFVIRLEFDQEYGSLLENDMKDSVGFFWKNRALKSHFTQEYGIDYISSTYDELSLAVKLRLSSLKSLEKISNFMQSGVLVENLSKIFFYDVSCQTSYLGQPQEKVKLVVEEEMKENLLQQLQEREKQTFVKRVTPKMDDGGQFDEEKEAKAKPRDQMTDEHKRLLYGHIQLLISEIEVDTVLEGLSEVKTLHGEVVCREKQRSKEKRILSLVECLTSAEDSAFYLFLDVLQQSQSSIHVAEVLQRADLPSDEPENVVQLGQTNYEDTFYFEGYFDDISPYAKMKDELCGLITLDVISRSTSLIELQPAEAESIKSGSELLQAMEKKGKLSRENVQFAKTMFNTLDVQTAVKVVEDYENHLKNVNNRPRKPTRRTMLSSHKKVLNAIIADTRNCIDVGEAVEHMTKEGIFNADEALQIQGKDGKLNSAERFLYTLKTKDDDAYLNFLLLVSKKSQLLAKKIIYLERKYSRDSYGRPLTAEKRDFFSDLGKLTNLSLLNDGIQDNTANPIRLVLIGKTGVGKSSTGNTLLGRNNFKIPEGLFASCTKNIELQEIQSRNITIEVMDTPGLFDTSLFSFRQEESKLYELAKAILEFREGIDVFLLVCRLDSKFTHEEKKTITFIEKRFGEEIYRHCLVVLTHGKLYTRKYDALQTLLSDADIPDGLRKLLHNVSKNVVMVENEFESDTFEKELMCELLRTSVCRFVSNNGGEKYSNKIFREVQGRIEQENEKSKRESESRKHIYSFVYKYIMTLNEDELNCLMKKFKLNDDKMHQLQDEIKSKVGGRLDKSKIQALVKEKILDCKDLIVAQIEAKQRKNKEEERLKKRDQKEKRDQDQRERKEKEKSKIQTRLISTMAMYIETSTEDKLELLIHGDLTGNDALTSLKKYVSENISSDEIVKMATDYINLNKDLIKKKLSEIHAQKERRKQESIELATQIIKSKLFTYFASLSEKDLQKLKEKGSLTRKQLTEYVNEFKDSECENNVNTKDIVTNIIASEIDQFIKAKEQERTKREQRIEAEKALEHKLFSFIENETEPTLKKLVDGNAFPDDTLKEIFESFQNHSHITFEILVQMGKELVSRNCYKINSKLQEVNNAKKELENRKHETEVQMQRILEKYFDSLTEEELVTFKEYTEIPYSEQAKIIEPLDISSTNRLVNVALIISNFVDENIAKLISKTQKEKLQRDRADEVARAKQLLRFSIEKFIENSSMHQIEILSDFNNIPYDMLEYITSQIGKFIILNQQDLVNLCKDVISENSELFNLQTQARIEDLQQQLTTLKLETESALKAEIVAYLEGISSSEELKKVRAENKLPSKTLANSFRNRIPMEIQDEIDICKISQIVIKEHIDMFVMKTQQEEEVKERQHQLQKFEEITVRLLFTYMEKQSETNLEKLLDPKAYRTDFLEHFEKDMKNFSLVSHTDICLLVENFVKQNRKIIEVKIANKKKERQNNCTIEMTKKFFTFAETLSVDELRGLKSNFGKNFPALLSQNNVLLDETVFEVQDIIRGNIDKHIDGYIARKLEEIRQAEERRQEKKIEDMKRRIQRYITKQISVSDEKELSSFLYESYPDSVQADNLMKITEIESNYFEVAKTFARDFMNENKEEITEKLQAFQTIREKQAYDTLIETTKSEITQIVDKNVREFLRKLGKAELQKMQAGNIKDELPEKIVAEIKTKLSKKSDLCDEKLQEIIRDVISSRTTIIEDIVQHELCFPNASIVTTKRGRISIGKLIVGDEVLTVNENSRVTFDKVFFLAHSESRVVASYVKIKTEKEKVIHISPKHFILVGDLQSTKLADEVMVNDTIFCVEGDTLIPDRVISVKYENSQGAHCPLTLNGTLIVDDVAASCFTSALSPSTSQILLTPLRLIYRFVPLPLYKLIFTTTVMSSLAKAAKFATDVMTITRKSIF